MYELVLPVHIHIYPWYGGSWTSGVSTKNRKNSLNIASKSKQNPQSEVFYISVNKIKGTKALYSQIVSAV